MNTERNFLVRRCLVLPLYHIRNCRLMGPMPILNLVHSLFRMRTLMVIPPMIMALMVILPGSAVLVHFDDRK